MSTRDRVVTPTVDVYESTDALAHAAADLFLHAAATSIFERGRFVVAISGGSTPRALFLLLATPPYAARVAWDAVHVCWIDERCVPPTDARSNFGAAQDALFAHVPIPAANVHRMRGEDTPGAAADSYEATLRSLLDTADGPPRTVPAHRLDLVLLGLGADGHTASIFPRSDLVRERTRWVCARDVPAVSMWRLTMTPPLINAAADVVFVVAGADKAEVVRRVLHEPTDPDMLPAHIIAPTAGRVRWLLDADAGRLLPRS